MISMPSSSDVEELSSVCSWGGSTGFSWAGGEESALWEALGEMGEKPCKVEGAEKLKWTVMASRSESVALHVIAR